MKMKKTIFYIIILALLLFCVYSSDTVQYMKYNLPSGVKSEQLREVSKLIKKDFKVIKNIKYYHLRHSGLSCAIYYKGELHENTIKNIIDQYQKVISFDFISEVHTSRPDRPMQYFYIYFYSNLLDYIKGENPRYAVDTGYEYYNNYEDWYLVNMDDSVRTKLENPYN